jgi:hypothetical protein
MELRAYGVSSITDYRSAALFPSAATYVATLVIDANPDVDATVAILTKETAPAHQIFGEPTLFAAATVSQEKIRSADSWAPFDLRWKATLSDELGISWTEFGATELRIVQGTQTGDDARFVIPASRVTRRRDNKVSIDESVVHASRLKHVARGRDIEAFRISGADYLFIPWVPGAGRQVAADAESTLLKLGGAPRNAQPGDLQSLLRPKVLLCAIGHTLDAAADEAGEWVPLKGAAGIAVVPRTRVAIRRLEALLNSSLYQWLLRGLGAPRANGFVQLFVHNVEALPYPSLGLPAWNEIERAGRVVRRALQIEDPVDRTNRWWVAIDELDETVLNALKASSRLRQAIAVEFERPA